jgi:hypothetical protein
MEENRKLCSKLTVLPVAPLLAESIRRLNSGESVSYLFDHTPDRKKGDIPKPSFFGQHYLYQYTT